VFGNNTFHIKILVVCESMRQQKNIWSAGAVSVAGEEEFGEGVNRRRRRRNAEE